MTDPPIVAYRILADGTRTPIYDDGKEQWYVNEIGQRVYGVHFIPPDDCPKPLVVDDREF